MALGEKVVSIAVQRDVDSERGSITSIQNNTEGDELERRFSLWSTIALQVSMICSPIALGTFLSTVVGVGGSPGLIYGFILAVSCDLIICYSMAELASAYPHSSAQIHWTYCLSPKKYRKLLSFITGVLSCAGWIFAIFSTTISAAYFIISLIEMYHESYVAKNWHTFLIYAAIIIGAFLINAFAVQTLPMLTYISAFIINVGTLFILITLLARADKKQSADFVWKKLSNETGWSSKGVVFFLSLLPSIACITVFEGPCHQTDEIAEPEKNIPLVMIISNTFSALFAFAASIIYMYCITNVENLSDPIGGEPIVQLMLDSFRSEALTTIGVLFLVLTFVLSLVGYVCSASRLFWSFANSNGIPFGKSYFGIINKKFKTPMNSLVIVCLISIILGTMIFGSAGALAAVLGSSMVCLNLSYIVPMLLLLIKSNFSSSPYLRFPMNEESEHKIKFSSEGGKLPYFSLGKLGMPLNVIAVVWACFIMVWLNFPSTYPVTTENMNYACAVLGVTMIIGIIIWLTYARVHYDHNAELKHI